MLNIKKQIIMVLMVISFLVLPSSTNAVPPLPNRGMMEKEMMGKDKIKMFGEKAVLRLTAALTRAESFRQRVTLHADRFPNPRFDKTVVTQKLSEASEAIAKGRLAVTAIKTAMTNAMATTTIMGMKADGSFADTRMKIREAMTAVRVAHQKIVEAIRLIKASNSDQSASSSPLSN